jgi:hypothetical protein
MAVTTSWRESGAYMVLSRVGVDRVAGDAGVQEDRGLGDVVVFRLPVAEPCV